MSLGIWNSLDELALYLGLERLPKENDDSFKERIYNVSRYMYKNNGYSLHKSICGQTGFKAIPLLKIDSDKNFSCNINYDYFTLETDTSYIRLFIGRETIKLSEIVDKLNKLSDINFVLYNDSFLEYEVKNIIKNTNIKFTEEFASETSIQLKHGNIEEGSVEFSDKTNFNYRVDNLGDLNFSGEYYIDYKNGYIQSYSASDLGQTIKYKYIDKPFIIEYSDLALTPVSQYFKYGITKDSIRTIEFLLHRNTWK